MKATEQAHFDWFEKKFCIPITHLKAFLQKFIKLANNSNNSQYED